MNPVISHARVRTLYDRFLMVHEELTALAEADAVLLDQGMRTLTLTPERNTLVHDYVALSCAVRDHANVLHALGVLDPDDLEARIRHLSTVTKDNQRRLIQRADRTVARVESVMRALADLEICNDNTATAAGADDAPRRA